MNRHFAAILAVTTAAFAGNALAESPTVPRDTFVSTKSRADVQAELAQYKRAGVNPWSTQYNPLRGFQSTASRQAVTAQYLAERDHVAALTGEDSGSNALQAGRRAPASDTLAGQPVSGQ